MLNDFFRINLPYGIAKNEHDEWMAFNREYLPLGYIDLNMKELPGDSYANLPIYTKYQNVTEEFLLELAGKENALERNERGEICRVFLYSDSSNPRNQNEYKPELWFNYFDKLELLSKLEIPL